MIKSKLDRVGILVSGVCAVHCMMLPIVIAVLSMTGVIALNKGDAQWHDLLVGSTLTLGLWSIGIGYYRHRKYWAWVPMVLACALGFIALTQHAWLEKDVVLHTALYTVMGTLVVVAHFLNAKLAHGHMHDASCHH